MYLATCREIHTCSFGSFSIISLTPFIKKPASLGDLSIFMIFKSSFGYTNVVIPDPNIFLWIAASVVDTAIKTLLANNGLSTFSIKDKPVLSNGPKNPPT